MKNIVSAEYDIDLKFQISKSSLFLIHNMCELVAQLVDSWYQAYVVQNGSVSKLGGYLLIYYFYHYHLPSTV